MQLIHVEAFASVATIFQLLDYAVKATTKAARSIHEVHHVPQAQNNMQTRINFLHRTLGLLSSKLRRSSSGGIVGSGMSNISNYFNYKEEEQEILRMAQQINTDCQNCATRLEQLSMSQNNVSMGRRVMDQISQEFRKPEIQRIEARIERNMGNMQLLMSCLQLNAETDGNGNSQAQPLPITLDTDQDAGEWMQTTDRALQTADSLIDKLSRTMSNLSQGSGEIDVLSSTGDIPIVLQRAFDGTAKITTPGPSESLASSGETHHLQPDLMTSFLDASIHHAMESLE
ncbi:hypothetical protein UA08_08101 [Talaromyces atroroseus]|uniref:Uncharacterized protein n=1 Tax=Talaromyces atroroseus TaxID=1441469 RepID=A0A225ANF2_TALAT|nr:hypothetical protein UA08_08101 [Talaromyces atroroseus]OKL56476.1 hypothetical protein UA08_08101 [Talaromyces atroroseus]